MKKLVILVLVLAVSLIFAACSNDAVVEKNESVRQESVEEQQEKKIEKQETSLMKPRKAEFPVKKKISEKAAEDPVKAGLKAEEQAVLKAAVEAKLDQLAERMKIFSENPKESMEKMADAWLDKRSSEICEPVLERLADKIEKEPENEQIQAEIRREFDKFFKELDKEAENREKLNIEYFLYGWASGKADEKSADEEKKQKAATEKSDDKSQEDLPLTENKKNLIRFSLNIATVQKAIDRWSEKRMTALWNQALDKMVNNTGTESDIKTIRVKVEKQFDELNANLNKLAFVKAKFDRITDEAFFNFMLMMSGERRFEKIRKLQENNTSGEKIKKAK